MSGKRHPRRCSDDRDERINELKAQAKRLAKGAMLAWESDTLSPDQQEPFWQYVLEWETAPSTSHFQQLTEAGVELPEPDALNDERLASKLWEVIAALARLRVFITHTDHLSDRELYTALWHDVLPDEIPIVPDAPGAAWHVDLVGSGSVKDIELYMKYYADA